MAKASFGPSVGGDPGADGMRARRRERPWSSGRAATSSRGGRPGACTRAVRRRGRPRRARRRTGHAQPGARARLHVAAVALCACHQPGKSHGRGLTARSACAAGPPDDTIRSRRGKHASRSPVISSIYLVPFRLRSDLVGWKSRSRKMHGKTGSAMLFLLTQASCLVASAFVSSGDRSGSARICCAGSSDQSAREGGRDLRAEEFEGASGVGMDGKLAREGARAHGHGTHYTLPGPGRSVSLRGLVRRRPIGLVRDRS